MKIKVTHTYELSPSQVAALKIYWKEMRDDGESFRQFVRDYHNSAGSHYVFARIEENEDFIS